MVGSGMGRAKVVAHHALGLVGGDGRWVVPGGTVGRRDHDHDRPLMAATATVDSTTPRMYSMYLCARRVAWVVCVLFSKYL